MRIVATGETLFLHRMAPLFEALSPRTGVIELVVGGNLAEWLPLRFYNRLTRGTRFHDRLFDPDPNPAAFVVRSRQSERKIAHLPQRPDLVFHMFCTFAPVWTRINVPYVQYLDYTMAQAHREYPPWATFQSNLAYDRWLEYERRTYQGARHLFVMAEGARRSLITDYGVPADRISFVGNGGSICEPFTGTKQFGSGRLLLDGSDMQRKGGDLLIEAMPMLRQVVPHATLIIVGNTIETRMEGVVNPGVVRDRHALQELFQSADLVLSPTRCDPFPGFVVEGMNYGLPCIVSRANGLADLVQEHGAGLVLEELTPQACAHAIATLLTSPGRLAAMSLAGRQLVSERLNWRHIASLIADTLENIGS